MTDEPLGDPRSAISKGLAGYMTPEQVAFLIEEVLAIKKTPWVDVTCKHCRKVGRYAAEVPDAKAVAGALKDLLAEGFGRPDVAQSSEEDKIVFERVIYLTDADPPQRV